jgi:hypothetical protein
MFVHLTSTVTRGLQAKVLQRRKFPWTAYKNIHTIGGSPLTGQESAGASSKNSIKQNTEKEIQTPIYFRCRKVILF